MRRFLAITLALFVGMTGTTTASAAIFAYDAPIIAHGAADEIVAAEASTDQARDVREGAALHAVVARATSTTATPRSVATEAERTVVIGRNMGERVIPYAESNGADWYGGTPRRVPRGLIEKISPSALEKTDLWFNGRWINSEMQAGSRIVDSGEPPGYPPSPFYNMERTRVDGYWNLFKDPQP